MSYGGSVIGLSSLRQHEPKSSEPSEQAKQLQAYLSKYTDSDSSKPKKKKKKAKADVAGVPVREVAAVRIFEEDNSGFRGVPNQPEDVEEDDEEAPVVANPEEAERAMRQVQQLQTGADLEAWSEVPTIVGDIPSLGRQPSMDASPPRRRRHDSPDASPPRKPRQAQNDASPPRRKRQTSLDAEPLKRQRHDSPDASPPRRQHAMKSDADVSRRKRQADDDVSPPRRLQHHSPNASPTPRKRQTGLDASPPRRRHKPSPGADLPRRQQHDSPDASPPRRKRQADRDASPPRRKRFNTSPDASPKRKQAVEDVSPPRKRSKAGEELASSDEAGVGSRKPRFMADGSRAGQVSGAELAKELATKAQREAKEFAALGASVTGRGADTVYRDKSGKRVTLQELKAQQEASKKPVAETPEWGSGMAQKREAEERRKQLQAEAAKPFARTREDVDEHLKHRERFGDPMAHLVKKRPPVQDSIIPAALQKRMKKAGFNIPQEVPAHSWIKRNLGPPGNRYNIKPGRHWDGVDRSTGFEKEMFAIINERRNRSQAAHMWSQGDM